MTNPFSLAGETALITGGGSGLGFGIAECFLQAGAKVVLVGRRRDVLEASVKTLGKGAEFETHDVTKHAEAGALIKRLSKRVGPISILVNNAGVHLKKPAIETTPDEFNAVLQTHVVGAFSLTRAVLPGMIELKTPGRYAYILRRHRGGTTTSIEHRRKQEGRSEPEVDTVRAIKEGQTVSAARANSPNTTPLRLLVSDCVDRRSCRRS